jgi:hypothetical protein
VPERELVELRLGGRQLLAQRAVAGAGLVRGQAERARLLLQAGRRGTHLPPAAATTHISHSQRSKKALAGAGRHPCGHHLALSL